MNSIIFKKIILIIFMSLLSSAVFASKKIGVLVFDGVLTSDVTAPLEVFGVADKKSWFGGYDVITISVNKSKAIVTEEGITLGVDHWIGDDLKLSALVVPSSYSMEPLLNNKELIHFIQQTNTSAQFMMSNCSGASLLAKSGLLDGKKATTWAGGEGDMQKSFPDVLVKHDTNVVIDGKYITSNGSLVSYEAALIALGKMSSKDNAKEVFDALQMSRVTSWDRISTYL